MDKIIDARTLPPDAIEEKRRLAHRLRKRGLTRAEIGAMVWGHADTVGRWLKLDARSLVLRRSGRKTGDGCLLTPEQAKCIRRLLIDKTPDQLKIAYALWT